jgi:hypothetical protein
MNRGGEVLNDIFPVLAGPHEDSHTRIWRGLAAHRAEVLHSSDDTEVL